METWSKTSSFKLRPFTQDLSDQIKITCNHYTGRIFLLEAVEMKEKHDEHLEKANLWEIIES